MAAATSPELPPAAEAAPQPKRRPATPADLSPEIRAALDATLKPGQRLPTPAEIAEVEASHKLAQPQAVKPFRMERPFPAAPYWELTKYRADSWLAGNYCDDILRAVETAAVVDVSSDELLLLYYDLQFWRAWRRDWAGGGCDTPPPDPADYLLGRIDEEGNRHHWGDLARDIRALRSEREAEARRQAEALAARQEARRLREEARKYAPPRKSGRR